MRPELTSTRHWRHFMTLVVPTGHQTNQVYYEVIYSDFMKLLIRTLIRVTITYEDIKCTSDCDTLKDIPCFQKF